MSRVLSIFLVIGLLLGGSADIFTFGSGSAISRADLLSGAESVTLVREPQQTPGGLGSANLNGLQFANPAAQIDMIRPPVANNQGNAKITHPLSVPPGRAGVQPDLSLTYGSGSGNGWVGLGWGLSVGSVTIDTRWGVPRYDSAKETETYVLDGDVLTPTAVRSTLLDRAADRMFRRQVEGKFERIQRHGAGPGSYWWEVTDKSGARRYYGGTPEGGRDATAILANDDGKGFTWALTQIRDISNNTATFSYTTFPGSGVGLSTAAIGRELYLDSIWYTGTVAQGLSDDPAYQVRFVRASQLSETRRPDVSIDARGGFLRVTSDLLRHVEVYHRDSLVRRFVLNYSEGAFSKTLLQSVGQAGSDGVVFASHTFDYYDDVRPGGGDYKGFEPGSTWNTGDDKVKAAINLHGLGNHFASALGGSELLGGDGRGYIGYNPIKPGKTDSFGGAFVVSGDEGMSRLQLLDINGDNLPDKVFEKGGQVKYRLNTSGPDGGSTFGEVQTVTGIDNLSRDKSFSFSIGPEAYSEAVNIMYNHTWSSAWGKEYFIDVNTDGLVDFVDNGTVYFNTLNAEGKPVFVTDSFKTPVPIDPGDVDPSTVPDFSDIEAEQREQSPLQDTLRRWRAPWTGQVRVERSVQLLRPAGDDPEGDGVRVAIQHEGNELWATLIEGDDYTPKTPTGVSDITVNSGDDIYFRVQSRDDGASDRVSWDPLITYLGVATAQDANGLHVYRYQASEDFTLGGRTGIVAVAPLDGTVRVTGDFTKSRKTTDDITIQVFKNGALIGPQTTIGRDQTGTVPFESEFDVSVTDKVLLRLKIDSPVDLSAFSWTPRLVYQSATLEEQPVTVTDGDGDAILDLNAPVDMQIHPATDLVAPQAAWTSSMTGTLTVTPQATFSSTSEDGFVVVTVKKEIVPPPAGDDPPTELVAKKVLEVQNGRVVTPDPTFTVSVKAGAEYFFDLSVGQPGLGSAWQSGSVRYKVGSDDKVLPSARHWAFIPDDHFPQSYRGWGFCGYNGNGDWATAPIDESRLLFDPNDYPHAPPKGPDDKTYKNPVLGKAYAYTPFVEIDKVKGIAIRQWRGSRTNLFGSASAASSSRVGSDHIGFPGAHHLGDGRAVARYSFTQADAIGAKFIEWISGSSAWGTSEGRLDFLDMNGDQFPDIVGNGGVQYTTARGGLANDKTPIPEFAKHVRKDNSTTQIGGLGGDVAKIKSDSKGDSNTPQDAAAAGARSASNSAAADDTGAAADDTGPADADAGPAPADTGAADSGGDSQAITIGVSGQVGLSSTNTKHAALLDKLMESELADINGDGLPDRIRVYRDGVVEPKLRITVAFNTGYGFDANEIEWPGGSFEQGNSLSFGLGASLGFSTPNREFTGGLSVNRSKGKSLSTWVDLNSDGLLDQLLLSGDEVKVRFGTGAGLTGPVSWGAFHDNEIAQKVDISLGEGVDFTISIPLCLAACWLIINPGVHIEDGMSRQELHLDDVNGDGYPDQIASTTDKSMNVSLNTTGRTGLLKSVANPLGGEIRLDYTREGNTTSQAFSQWVLSRVEVDDGRPGDGPDKRLTTFEYADNTYDALGRTFLGYATVTEHQLDASERVLRSFERAYRHSTIFEKGLLERETLLGPGGAIKETVNEWRFVDVGTGNAADLNPAAGVGLSDLSVFPQRVKTETRSYHDGAIVKNTWNTFAYDALGNVVQTVDVGEPDLHNDDVTAITTYTDCTSSSWVSLPDSFKIRGPGSRVLRSRRAELLCKNGAVTKLWEDTGSGEALTELGFNAYGSYNYVVYPPNDGGERYRVDYVYDDDRHTDIAQVKDSFGLAGEATYHGPTGQIASETDANGQTTSYTYDPQGRLASITGPYEQGTGKQTVTLEYFPTAAAYAYGLAHHYDAFHPADPIDTASFLDGIGRQTQTKQDATLFRGASQAAAPVMVVAGAVEFDALGRAVKEWYPIEEPLGTIGTYNTHVDTEAPPALTEWDLQDRVTRVTAPSGSITATTYGYGGQGEFGTTMHLYTRTDPMGNARRSYVDVRGNVLAISVDHDTGRAPVRIPTSLAAPDSDLTQTFGPETYTTKTYLPLVAWESGTRRIYLPVVTSDRSTAAVQTLQTRYLYDPLQQLVEVIDPGGNSTTHEYDLLGRRTATTTPDGGRVELAYDLASQVIARVTPNLRAGGGQISYAYEYNRLAGISYTDGTPKVTYTYGGPGAPDNGAGRIIKVEDGARTQLRSFGRLGEVVAETTTMLVHNIKDNTDKWVTWTTSSEFETWGRPKTVTYPDGEVVTYGYDSGGLNASVAGEKAGTAYPYVDRQEYDKFGARRFLKTDNDVATEIRYDPKTRRLSQMTTDAPGRRVQDITYTYDHVGNALTAGNAAPAPTPDLMGGPSQQTFAYDDLYRLVTAAGTYDFSPGKHRDYTYDLVYDNLGNIVQKSQTDTVFNNPNDGIPQAKTTYNQLYDYAAAPHQPTHIGDRSFTYDASGNLTGWTDDKSGQNRTVTWDAEDRVTSVADEGSTTRYKYDDQDRLAIARGPDGETSFVNRFYTVQNGSVAWKHFWAGTERLATKQEMPDDEFEHMLYFLHKDLLGSTNFVTDENGLVFEYLEYFPGGETWVLEHSDIYDLPYLYSGGYYDEFRELYNFWPRWYGPRDQLFYSPDPALVQSPRAPIGDPAMLAAYTYAQDNPLRLVEVDGLGPEYVQKPFLATFSRPNGSLDMAKARLFKILVQQQAAER